MQRLLRWIHRSAVGVTLLIALVLLSAWVISYRLCFAIGRANSYAGATAIGINRGRITLSHYPAENTGGRPPRGVGWQTYSFPANMARPESPIDPWPLNRVMGGSWPGPYPIPVQKLTLTDRRKPFAVSESRVEWERLGCRHSLGLIAYPDLTANVQVRFLTFSPPYLAAATALALLLPLRVAARSLAGRRTAKPGHCPACGYDLRATPERCPECGHTPGR